MSYRLEHDETIIDGVQRIGREQSDKALDRLETLDDLEADVHSARKHCKKLRGLVRLVRPGMEEEYQLANTAFRDAARELAPMRDAHALLGTFDDMIEVSEVAEDRFDTIREALTEDAREASERDDLGARIARASELIVAGAARIPRWTVDDPVAAILAGVEKTYRRGRQRLADSAEVGEVDDRHEWRKRVKYGWYHTRLLENAAPSIFDPLSNRMHDLSDALGDDHDLAVLSARIGNRPARFGSEETIESVMRLIAGWQFELQRRALSLGQRLYAEKPKHFARRTTAYVEVWRSGGPELEAGELEDLWDPVTLG